MPVPDVIVPPLVPLPEPPVLPPDPPPRDEPLEPDWPDDDPPPMVNRAWLRRRGMKANAQGVAGAVLLTVTLVASGAQAQTTTRRSYDAGGREIGRAEVRPDGATRYRDEHGYEVGRSERRLDGTTRYFSRLGPPVRYGALGD